MSRTRHGNWRDDLGAGIRALTLAGVSPWWLCGNADRQRELVFLVRRLRAAGYDAADCIASGAPAAERHQVRTLARGLQGIDG